MAKKTEYRMAVALSPMGKTQLTQEYGEEGFELLDIVDAESGGTKGLFHVFQKVDHKLEYKIQVSEGIIGVNQLNVDYGPKGWSLVDIFKWDFRGEEKFYHVFKRVQVKGKRKSADVISIESSVTKPMDKGIGTDEIGVMKE